MVKGTVGAVKGAADWVFDVALGTDAERAAAWNSAASFVRETAETVKVMGEFVMKVQDDQDAFIAAVLNGQWEDANKIAAPYQMAVEYSAEFVKETWNEYLGSGVSDFQRGEIFGGIMFEVAALAAPYCKAGQVAQVSKLEFLCQLRSAAFCQRFPRAAVALERVITALEEVGVHGCFVAGTPVHTDHGWKNIEEIRPGDRVLSRDLDTGWQGFTPVTRVSISQAERVYHLSYRVRELRSVEIEKVSVNGIDTFLEAGA